MLRKQNVMTNADIKGLLIVNMFRKKLTNKIKPQIDEMASLTESDTEKANELFEQVSGQLAVADALDIITDEEYADACDALISLFQNNPIAPIVFGKLTTHYCKDYDLDETRVVFKVNVQERVNENFARCRQHNLTIAPYSAQDCLDANTLIITFAREFEILRKDEYDKAMKMIKDYRAGKMEPDDFLMVPKQFYTKLQG